MNSDYFVDFGLAIKFKKGSENPSRVFRATANLIEAFQELDIDLAHSININIEPILLLQDIQSGSIKTWLRTFLTSIPDEGIKNFDWKKLVGGYLLKGKERLVNLLSDKEEITNREQIETLKQEVFLLAQGTEILSIPAYAPVPSHKLLRNIEKITNSLSVLNKDDEAAYITDYGEFPFNLSFRLASEAVEEFATRETIENDNQMILQVKRPDFLGESMWEFKHEGKSIQAKITDLNWLHRFHTCEFIITPGDSLRATVHVEVKYGYDHDVIASHYYVTQVHEILPLNRGEQRELFKPL